MLHITETDVESGYFEWFIELEINNACLKEAACDLLIIQMTFRFDVGNMELFIVAILYIICLYSIQFYRKEFCVSVFFQLR